MKQRALTQLSDVFVAVPVVVAVRWPIFNDWNPISQEAVFSEVSLFCVFFCFCFFFPSIFIQGHPIKQAELVKMAALTQHKTKDTKTRKLIKLQRQHVPQALLFKKAL